MQRDNLFNGRGAIEDSKTLNHHTEQLLTKRSALRIVLAKKRSITLLITPHSRRYLEPYLLNCERCNFRDRHDCQPRLTQSNRKSVLPGAAVNKVDGWRCCPNKYSSVPRHLGKILLYLTLPIPRHQPL